MQNRTRVIAYAGLISAAYFLSTVAFAPISYGPIQFRVSELLKPLALVHPMFAIAFAIGNGMANLFSPFGPWDYIAMPIVDCIAALLCYWLRRWPIIAVTMQALVISLGVAVFPLGLGAHFPFLPTFISVLISELILLLVGYVVIRKTPLWSMLSIARMETSGLPKSQ